MKQRFDELSQAEQEKAELAYHKTEPNDLDVLMSQAKTKGTSAMETVAYEQALSVVEALLPEDQRRLWQWLEEKQSQPVNGAARFDSGRESEMRWLSQHRSEYVGQWVALAGDRLICHDADLGKVFDEAQQQGFASPFTAFMEDPERPSMGGW